MPFQERVAIHTKQAAYRSYVVAGPEGRRQLAGCAAYGTDGDPYHYVRLAEDAQGAPYVIVGGEDHKTGQSEDTESFPRLQQWAREHLPGVERFTCRLVEGRSWSPPTAWPLSAPTPAARTTSM